MARTISKAPLFFFAALASGMLPVYAEQLPVQTFTVSRGLLPGAVWHIAEDQSGFLWFSTSSGLSRFDGFTFRNYGPADGLPSRTVCCLLERHNGERWVGTSRGICRYQPDPHSLARFNCYSNPSGEEGNRINALLDGAGNQFWINADDGIYRVQETPSGLSFELVLGTNQCPDIHSAIAVSDGSLWAVVDGGVCRRLPSGNIEHYRISGEPKVILEVADGELWIGTRLKGVVIFKLSERSGKYAISRSLARKNGLAADDVNSLARTANGQVWIGTREGLSLYDGHSIRSYTRNNGLPDPYFRELYVDREGDLWAGAESGGVMHIRHDGLVTLDDRDGLVFLRSLLLTRSGEVVVLDDEHKGRIRFNVWDGSRFHSFEPAYPGSIKDFGWGATHIAVEDHLGDWWIATSQGLLRFPKPAHLRDLATTAPVARYTTHEGLPTDNIYSIYEDGHGDLWIGCMPPGQPGMARWNRAQNRIETFEHSPELPPSSVPSSFLDDNRGNLWMGFYGGGVVRYRDGHFSAVGADGGPKGIVEALYQDSQRRVWGSSTGAGIFEIKDLNSDHPSYSIFRTAADVGSSISSLDLLESSGSGDKLYAGATGVGVVEIDKISGSTRMFTRADGLAGEYLQAILRDPAGNLWFGMTQGLSIYRPSSSRSEPVPPVWITGVMAGEEKKAVSDLGDLTVKAGEISPAQNRIEIQVGSVSLHSPVRFQYRLEGASGGWSPPQDDRIFRFPSLRPGAYRFVVRALNRNDLPSSQMASVAFTILPPIWQRWWFEILAAIALLLLAYSAYRLRVRQLLAVERMRTRIASDLHDDIGAGLSQIAIHSEVLRQNFSGKPGVPTDKLAIIADTARELTASMSDIVWAINPRRDHLEDLISRMKAFALDVCGTQGVELIFVAPEEGVNPLLTTEVRRELLLIFKEAVNNVVRHAQCTRLTVTLTMKQGSLLLSIHDNGRGFIPSGAGGGHGIGSMKTRASRIGARFRLTSTIQQGTGVDIDLPLHQRSRSSTMVTGPLA
jgi:signal transduction histidine kinase/ligand-binding sensor domain-containing protein